jgi:hypothetical protein
MGTFFKTYKGQPERGLVLHKVKRRGIVEALVTCGDDYTLAAQSLGDWDLRRMVVMSGYASGCRSRAGLFDSRHQR